MTRRNLIKPVLAVFIFLTVIVIGTIVYVYHNSRSSVLSFVQFEPKYLPEGVHITGKTVEIRPGKFGSMLPNKNLRFSFNDSTFTVAEEKKIEYRYDCTPLVDNEKCSTEETPKHQKYELRTSEDSQMDQRVYLLKDGTHIWIISKSRYSKEQYDLIVDSFKTVNYGGLPVRIFDGGV